MSFTSVVHPQVFETSPGSLPNAHFSEVLLVAASAVQQGRLERRHTLTFLTVETELKRFESYFEKIKPRDLVIREEGGNGGRAETRVDSMQHMVTVENYHT